MNEVNVCLLINAVIYYLEFGVGLSFGVFLALLVFGRRATFWMFVFNALFWPLFVVRTLKQQ